MSQRPTANSSIAITKDLIREVLGIPSSYHLLGTAYDYDRDCVRIHCHIEGGPVIEDGQILPVVMPVYNYGLSRPEWPQGEDINRAGGT